MPCQIDAGGGLGFSCQQALHDIVVLLAGTPFERCALYGPRPIGVDRFIDATGVLAVRQAIKYLPLQFVVVHFFTGSVAATACGPVCCCATGITRMLNISDNPFWLAMALQ